MIMKEIESIKEVLADIQKKTNETLGITQDFYVKHYFDQLNEYGDTALMQAAKKGYYQLVDKLIKAGADVNIANNTGETALMYAACDWNVTNEIENTELFALKYWGRLPESVRRNHRIVDELMKAGADIAAKNKNSDTALIFAASHNNSSMIYQLVEGNFLWGRGENVVADIEAKNKNGYTALMIAAIHSCPNAVEALIDLGANVRAVNNEGKTALDYAKKNLPLPEDSQYALPEDEDWINQRIRVMSLLTEAMGKDESDK